MHELGLTRRIVAVANQRAADAGATRITAVHFEIGEESDVSPLSLELYWPEAARGTAAASASLLFSAAADPDAFRMIAIDVDEDSPRE